VDVVWPADAAPALADVVWPIEEARNLALSWIDRAIEAGGAGGARMLARKVRLAPQEFPELLGRSLQLMAEADEESISFSWIFAQELVAAGATEETRLLARAAARRLVAQARGNEPLLQKLLDASGDAAFRADVRAVALRAKLPEAVPLSSRSTPVQIERNAADQGTGPIFDAAALPDGRFLIARGELGALLLSRAGKIIARFSEPAHSIVISDQASWALLLAPRGEIFRISRLNLITRQIEPWCDARFDIFARDFDGLTWFVAHGGAVYAVDASASRWEHLWKVEEKGARVLQVRRDSSAMSVWFDWMALRQEIWTYDLPSLYLRRRWEAGAERDAVAAWGMFPGGELLEWFAGRDGAFKARVRFYGGLHELPIDPPAGHVHALCLTKEWIVLSAGNELDTEVSVLDCAGCKLRARIGLQGAGTATGARIQGERLLIWDSCGRLILLSLKSGAVLQEHRLP
jgi:hypothetical protein